MKRLLIAALLSAGLMIGTAAAACEKHLNGHQNSSDTNAEAVGKQRRSRSRHEAGLRLCQHHEGRQRLPHLHRPAGSGAGIHADARLPQRACRGVVLDDCACHVCGFATTLSQGSSASADGPLPAGPGWPRTAQGTPLYGNLGSHHYPFSIRNRQAQAQFDQGLRLYYAFNHAEAIRAFRHSPRENTAEILRQLETILRIAPNHPGANHFQIHAIEEVQAERAVVSAERLADLVPRAGHIVPMPCHRCPCRGSRAG